MEPVTSVAAFIAGRLGRSDAAAEAIVAALDDDARAVVEAQAVAAAQRLAWLRARTGRDWSPAWLAHVEQRAWVELRRALQARGLWRS